MPRASSQPQPITPSSAALALVACLLWGGNLVALKLGLEVFPPFWSGWWRFALGVVAVGLWARSQGIVLNPAGREWRQLTILGLMFTGQIVLLNSGLALTSPAYGVVILNAHPIFSNLIGHWVSSEQRLSRLRLFGLAMAFCGVCYLAAGKPVERLAPNPLLGNVLLISSALLLGVRMIYTRRIVQGIEPVKAVVWQMLISLPLFLTLAVVFEPAVTGPITLVPVLAILYQGIVVATISFVLWTMLLRRHAAGTLAMFMFTVPLFGIVYSALVFDEPITSRILIAAALVMAGIALVVRPSGAPVSETHPATE